MKIEDIRIIEEASLEEEDAEEAEEGSTMITRTTDQIPFMIRVIITILIISKQNQKNQDRLQKVKALLEK